MTTATGHLPDNAGAADDDDHTGPDPRRWLVLGIIAIAQLMVVLDATIVNIALPKAQQALDISTANRQWIVTAYTLAFGGLLLLGGRIADFAGRKRAFVGGLLGFALASALGGIAPNAGLLFAARALQGALAAVLAPAALSIITVTFVEPKERAKAFGVWGAIAAGGSAVGLIMGGVLTEYASWRWCLLVNVPIAAAAALAALPVLTESRAEGERRYDVTGGLTVTVGLVALVYGFTKAGEDGWSDAVTVASLIVAVVLLAAFVLVEMRSKAPLLPLRVPGDRDRGGSFLASVLIGAGFLAMFLFMTYYMQSTLGYSPLRTGFAYMPFSLGVILTAGVAAQLMPRLGPKIPMLVGVVFSTVGLLMLTQVGAHTSYVSHVLPPMIVMSIGMGLVFVPLSSTALVGVADHDAGVASALVNSTQQVGGALGTALLNTVFTTAFTNYLADHAAAGAVAKVNATIHGYSEAFLGSALLMGSSFFVILFFLRNGNQGAPAAGPAAVAAPSVAEPDVVAGSSDAVAAVAAEAAVAPGRPGGAAPASVEAAAGVAAGPETGPTPEKSSRTAAPGPDAAPPFEPPVVTPAGAGSDPAADGALDPAVDGALDPAADGADSGSGSAPTSGSEPSAGAATG